MSRTSGSLLLMSSTLISIRSALKLLPLLVIAQGRSAVPPKSVPPPAQLTAKEDHRRLMDLLGIASLRPGASGQNPNLDESKANPFPTLPDPLTLKNGQKVTTADAWWKQRRPEILEDFKREIYGRTPKVTPTVTWQVTNTVRATNGDVPVITIQLIGRVDNSSYPAVTVNIALNLTTPANASGPVPVMMQFGFIGFGGTNRFGRGFTNAANRFGGTNGSFFGPPLWHQE